MREGASTAFFRSPRWEGLATGPGVVATLVLLVLAQSVAFQRLYVEGPAVFYWQAVASGWLPFALLPFYALLVRGAGASGRPGAAPDMAALATMLLAQTVWLELFLNLCFSAQVFSNSEAWSVRYLGRWGAWLVWGIPVALAALSQLALLARGGRGRRWPLALAAGLMAAVLALGVAARQPDFWSPDKEADEDDAPPSHALRLTPELMEAQPVLLSRQLAALAPQRPGKVDMYALTFAPSGADV